MKNNNYTKSILNANTLEEVALIKESFLTECENREKKILVSGILAQIQNFGGAQAMFESLIVPLLKEKGGKRLIKRYINTIKENKSLKTLYTYNEGLKVNKTPETKKAYITEALTLSNQINYNEYVKGVGDITSLICTAFNLLGDKYVLENVSYDKTSDSIGKSLVYLASTNKDIKNLNEYISHIENVSETIVEKANKDINVDLPLEDIVTEMKQTSNNDNMSFIFNTDNKEKTFCEAKEVCLNMIKQQKLQNKDEEVITKLTEMENKLHNKQYTFETFTKDMLYMSELQEVLK
jgi:hypothetical protein